MYRNVFIILNEDGLYSRYGRFLWKIFIVTFQYLWQNKTLQFIHCYCTTSHLALIYQVGASKHRNICQPRISSELSVKLRMFNVS